jgi:uncharacterized repeat protein (TIGR03803 family)
VKAPDGTLYGTTVANPSTQAAGGVFSLRAREDGSYEYRLLHEFTVSGNAGRFPYADLALASDGHLYGTTGDGGVNSAGTVFRVTTEGVFTSLHSFEEASGRFPMGTLVQGADGYLYGTTAAGGRYGLGTIFRISTSGAFTLVHSFWWFDGAAADGRSDPGIRWAFLWHRHLGRLLLRRHRLQDDGGRRRHAAASLQQRQRARACRRPDAGQRRQSIRNNVPGRVDGLRNCVSDHHRWSVHVAA